MRTRTAAALTGLAALAALGSAAAADKAVTITSTGFNPRDVTVASGDTVTWKNNDSASHRIVFDKTPCNLTISTGESGTCKFLAGGKFNYRDPSFQGNMFRGSVTVTGARNSVSLAASARTVAFMAPVTLTGVVSSQAAGEAITVNAQECGKTAFARAGAATTTAGGNWTALLKPTINTVYRAHWKTVDSPIVTVNVRPAIRLSRVGSRFKVQVTAAQGFTGKLVLFQRYRAKLRRWTTLKRVTLGTAAPPFAGAVVTPAAFRNRVRRGWRLRVFMPQAQVGACYVSAPSNTLRVR